MSPLAPVFEFSVFDIAKTQKPPGLAAEVLAFIAKLYEIERRLREHPPMRGSPCAQPKRYRCWVSQFKTWLLAGSPRCGETAAVAFSLIETAKLNGTEPCAYLNDVLRRLRSHRIDRLTVLLPFTWKPAA